MKFFNFQLVYSTYFCVHFHPVGYIETDDLSFPFVPRYAPLCTFINYIHPLAL